MKSKTRFERFKAAMKRELGENVVQLNDGQIMVLRNEFSPNRFFYSTQAEELK